MSAAATDSSTLFRVDGIVAVITGGGTGEFPESLSLDVLCIETPHVDCGLTHGTRL